MLMQEIGKTFANHFESKQITKVITVESSGISPAVFTALELKVPLVVCKKSNSEVLDKNSYSTQSFSFTHNDTLGRIASLPLM